MANARARPEAEIKAGKAYKSDIALPLKHIAEFYDEAVAMAQAINPKRAFLVSGI